MSQIPLCIVPVLPYSPARFLQHTGVKSICDDLSALVSLNQFAIRYINGQSRSGKTHLSVWFADRATELGAVVYALEGAQFDPEILVQQGLNRAGIYIIDDVDQYLCRVLPGSSGPFVSFVEQLRVLGAKLVLFSSVGLEGLPCDEHVRSRIIPGLGPVIADPASVELPELLGVLAHQRGFALTDRKINSLALRLERSISGLEKFLETAESRASVEGSSGRAFKIS